ncbi:MAG: hypothetical protein R3B37_14970 [Nitrospira sp.]|nr:hypothetical protein [Nitrospira sp.]
MSGRVLFAVSAAFALSLAGDTDPGLAESTDRVPPPNVAEEDVFDQAPVAEGIIERYLLDPRGEVEGLLLRDGSHMYVTSRAEEHLIRAITPGDHVRVYGRRTTSDGLVQPDVIKNLSQHTTFIVPIRLDLPMQEQEAHVSVTQMYAAGTIRVLLYHAFKDMVQGMILSDETQIRLPLDTSAELRRSFHVGDSVVIRGHGTTTKFGRAIEAVAIGSDRDSLVPLGASLRREP